MRVRRSGRAGEAFAASTSHEAGRASAVRELNVPRGSEQC